MLVQLRSLRHSITQLVSRHARGLQSTCPSLAVRPCHGSDTLFVPVQSVVVYTFHRNYGRTFPIYLSYLCGVCTAIVATGFYQDIACVWVTVSMAPRLPVLSCHHDRAQSAAAL